MCKALNVNYEVHSSCLKPRKAPEHDDRRYVGPKLVNIAQPIDRSQVPVFPKSGAGQCQSALRLHQSIGTPIRAAGMSQESRISRGTCRANHASSGRFVGNSEALHVRGVSGITVVTSPLHQQSGCECNRLITTVEDAHFCGEPGACRRSLRVVNRNFHVQSSVF